MTGTALAGSLYKSQEARASSSSHCLHRFMPRLACKHKINQLARKGTSWISEHRINTRHQAGSIACKLSRVLSEHSIKIKTIDSCQGWPACMKQASCVQSYRLARHQDPGLQVGRRLFACKIIAFSFEHSIKTTEGLLMPSCLHAGDKPAGV